MTIKKKDKEIDKEIEFLLDTIFIKPKIIKNKQHCVYFGRHSLANNNFCHNKCPCAPEFCNLPVQYHFSCHYYMPYKK